LNCEKMFEVYPYKIKIGRGKYCSYECYWKNKIGKKLSEKTRKKISEITKGSKPNRQEKNSHKWKGGKYKDKFGYIRIYARNHPLCPTNGYMVQSHLVAEKYLKRHLTRGEVMHHIDENKSNDKPKNLYLFHSQGKHLQFHRWKNKPVLTSNLINL